MKNHKSYAAYKAYQRMYTDMTVVDVDGQLKIECNYDYREPIEEKFALASTNKEEALKATNAVISKLTRIGRLRNDGSSGVHVQDIGKYEARAR